MKKCALVLLALISSLCTKAQEWKLLFNEIGVANIDQFIDPSYNYGSWVEIYNPSPLPLNLWSMVLTHTDSDGITEQKTLWVVHGTLQPKGYAILWFDHYNDTGQGGPNAFKQIPFKLDEEGGTLKLSTSDGRILDQITYPPAIARSSYKREKDGGKKWAWTNQPTPGTSNNGSPNLTKRLESPQVSRTGGLFTANYAFQVDIPAGTTLHYSTDGSTPIPGKAAVSKDGIFRGDQTTIYRFLLTREGYLNSPVTTRTFLKKDREYYLPILNVSTAPAHLYDDSIGVYVRGKNGITANNSGTPANQNMDWERPVNMEYFVPDAAGNYAECLNQECEFSIFGGFSRFLRAFQDWECRPSFKLKSNKVYEQVNTFAYPLFPSKQTFRTGMRLMASYKR